MVQPEIVTSISPHLRVVTRIIHLMSIAMILLFCLYIPQTDCRAAIPASVEQWLFTFHQSYIYRINLPQYGPHFESGMRLSGPFSHTFGAFGVRFQRLSFDNEMISAIQAEMELWSDSTKKIRSQFSISKSQSDESADTLYPTIAYAVQWQLPVATQHRIKTGYRVHLTNSAIGAAAWSSMDFQLPMQLLQTQLSMNYWDTQTALSSVIVWKRYSQTDSDIYGFVFRSSVDISNIKKLVTQKKTTYWVYGGAQVYRVARRTIALSGEAGVTMGKERESTYYRAVELRFEIINFVR